MDSFMNRLLRICFTYLGNEANAEDCVQTAFMKAYHSMHQLSDPANPFPWLVRIAMNECRMLQRKRWREVLSNVIPEQQSSSAEAKYLQQARDQGIYEAVLSLPKKYRMPIVLQYFEGLSTNEIGQILGINSATIRTRVARARRLLETSLQEVGLGEFGRRATER
jgi:RNA polymerase sigma-70 factor (ECF subfamily)